MTKHITVGYDGTPSSTEAVRWAAVEASSRGAGLRIITCYEIPVGGAAMFGSLPTEAYSVLLTDAETQLAAMRETVVEAHPGLDVATFVSADAACSVLVADTEAEDLIVVGASSHHGPVAFWVGSTPRSIIRHASCPVVVVRGAASRGRPDRVVVGVDGSPAAEQSLAWAGDAADRHGVPLVVVHGWHYPYGVTGTTAAQARDLTEVDAACVLDHAVEFARERFAAEVTGCLVEAVPATALLDTVRDGDLLVVGCRCRGALVAQFFGSTVTSVLEQAAVPVVVVTSRRERS